MTQSVADITTVLSVIEEEASDDLNDGDQKGESSDEDQIPTVLLHMTEEEEEEVDSYSSEDYSYVGGNEEEEREDEEEEEEWENRHIPEKRSAMSKRSAGTFEQRLSQVIEVEEPSIQSESNIIWLENVVQLLDASGVPREEPIRACHMFSRAFKMLSQHYIQLIDDIVHTIQEYRDDICTEFGEEEMDNVDHTVIFLLFLKDDVIQNKPFRSLPFTSYSDVGTWNSFVKSHLSNGWYLSNFLYTECYFQRRIVNAFKITDSEEYLDGFRLTKSKFPKYANLFLSVIAEYIAEYRPRFPIDTATAEMCKEIHKMKSRFLEVLQLSLWGDTIRKLVVSEDFDNLSNALKRWQGRIIADDSLLLWEYVVRKRPLGSVDIVLENADSELLCDLCLADFLISSKLACHVTFHVKCFRWFLDNATKCDFASLLQKLESSKDTTVKCLACRWRNYFRKKIWEIAESFFWTYPYEYEKMLVYDMPLYVNLKLSSLIIFKGDLNYRKLVGDVNWNPLEHFSVALRSFHPAPLVALRPIKSEVLCGIGFGTCERMDSKHPEWFATGALAVIHFEDEPTEHLVCPCLGNPRYICGW